MSLLELTQLLKTKLSPLQHLDPCQSYCGSGNFQSKNLSGMICGWLGLLFGLTKPFSVWSLFWRSNSVAWAQTRATVALPSTRFSAEVSEYQPCLSWNCCWWVLSRLTSGDIELKRHEELALLELSRIRIFAEAIQGKLWIFQLLIQVLQQRLALKIQWIRPWVVAYFSSGLR